MNFQINEESVACSVVLFCVIFFRLIFETIRNKKKFPNALFSGKYLFLFLVKFVFGLLICIFALFYSNDFYILGLFFTWLLIILCSISLIFVLWIIFFMHGYDIRYLFKKVILPCPIVILEFIVIFSTAGFTRNYIVIGFAAIYSLATYIWNYKGYKLTKPKIPDYVIIRENDDL